MVAVETVAGANEPEHASHIYMSSGHHVRGAPLETNQRFLLRVKSMTGGGGMAYILVKVDRQWTTETSIACKMGNRERGDKKGQWLMKELAGKVTSLLGCAGIPLADSGSHGSVRE